MAFVALGLDYPCFILQFILLYFCVAKTLHSINFYLKERLEYGSANVDRPGMMILVHFKTKYFGY
jgi:hypothetical protein